MWFMAYRKFYWIIFSKTFIFEVPSRMVRACKKSIWWVTAQNLELETNIFCRFYFRFVRFYRSLNFRCANFDSFSWRVCLHACMQLKTLSSLLNPTMCIKMLTVFVFFIGVVKYYMECPEDHSYPYQKVSQNAINTHWFMVKLLSLP